MIKLILLSSCLTVGGSLHAASGQINWQTENNSAFIQGDAAFLDGQVDTSWSGGFGVVGHFGAAVTLNDGKTTYQLTQSNSEGVGDRVTTGANPGLVGGNLNTLTAANDPYGGILGVSVFTTNGGPIEQTNTVNSITMTINFSAHTGGYADQVDFTLAGINAKVTGTFPDMSDIENFDAFSLKAFDETGAAVNLQTGGFFTHGGSGTATYDMSFSGGGTQLDVIGNLANSTADINAGNGNDHASTNTNLAVDFDTQKISSYAITYAPIVEGSLTGAGAASSGFAISNVNFQTVPEPSSFLLSFAGLAGLAFYRKRKA